MKITREKPIAVAGVVAVLALCYQLQAPQWVLAASAGLAAMSIGAWYSLEKRVAAWMPDSEFPNWLLIQMS